MMADRHCFEKS